MNKGDFLESWSGPSFGLTKNKVLKWKSSGNEESKMKVFGSSLTPADEKVLNAGGVVCHKKPVLYTKVFVKDEKGLLWSVVIPNEALPSLMLALKDVGYKLPAA